MSDTIKGQKLSVGTTKTLDELRNDSKSAKTFIPAIISDEANVKIPIDSFVSDSWKAWSERHGSSSEDGFERSYYIGSGNNVKHGAAFGDNNKTSGGMNIGYNNVIDANVYDLSNFNIGKDNSACYNTYGDISNSYNGVVNIGQRNKAGGWGVNLGENNFATLGSYNIGGYCSASHGSFVMGYKTTAEGGSVAIGFNNSAKAGEVIIGRDNDGTDGAGDYIIGHNNKVINGGALILGATNSAQGNSYIIGSNNNIRGGSIGLGDKSYATDGSTVIGNKSSAYAGSLVLLGDNTMASNGSIAIGGKTSASYGSISIGDNEDVKNLIANGSYNIGQNNSAKGGVYVIGNNNNANYEVKYDANGHIIEQNTNTTILGDNNYTENYIGEYSAIDRYTNRIDDGEGHIYDVTGYSAKFTGKTRSLIIGNNNSAIGWNQYSFGDKNFNGSTVYAYDSETSSYKTSGLKYRDTSTFNPITAFNDDLGYTFTFGRGNSAVRMFDMAIGLSSFASGGQNIAIGYGKTHIQGHNISSPDFTTTVKEGSRNIVYNSYLPGGYDNTLYNSYIDFGESGFCPMNQARNHFEHSIINSKKTEGASRTAWWTCDNSLFNSFVSAVNCSWFTNNRLFESDVYYTELNESYASNFCQNTLDDSKFHVTIGNQSHVERNTVLHANVELSNNAGINYDTFITDNLFLGDNDNLLKYNCNWSFCQNIILHPDVRNGYTAFNFRPDISNFITNNFMHKVKIDANHNLFNSMFTENFINGSKIQGSCKETYNEQTETYQYTYGGILPLTGKATGEVDINHTVAFGGTIKETNGCFIFAETSQYDDKPDSVINGAIRLYNFGDNSAAFITDSFIIGCNEVSGVNHSFINGYNNLVTYPVSLEYSANDLEKMNHGLVLFGDENTIDVVSANNSVSNNTVRGNKNIIKVESEFTDNRIIGNQNIFADINNSLAEEDYEERYNTLESPTPDYSAYSAGEAKQNYRNYIAGSKNIISNAESNNYIMGDANIVINTTPDDIIYANNVLLGNAQLAKNGSNQLAIGHGNVVDGYYSMAIGERLSAAGSQLVVGRYNAFVDGTDGTDNSNSGALFVVGNGHCPVDGHSDEDATRSNAMVVSADGTVSAKTYKADPDSKLGKLFEFLNDSTISTTGKLTWDGNSWSFAQ